MNSNHDAGDVHALRCPTCGAPLPTSAAGAASAVCAYCKAPLAITTQTATLGGDTDGVATAVRIKTRGQNNLLLIRVVRTLTGCGLADAKDLAESPLPFDIKLTQRLPSLAEALAELDACGCTWEVVRASRPLVHDAKPLVTGETVVVLERVGPNKIAVIQQIHKLAGCGLAEAKGLADKVPSRFTLRAKGVTAHEVVSRFADVGAEVRINRG
jgi:ribosomal protein L7/L12